jgi:serine/threonine protein phosphatase 1
MKRLVIGDIHGCYDELMELVDQAGLSADDEIIALGDLTDRGPDPGRVIDFFNAMPHAHAIMGNHEHKHLLCQQGVIQPDVAQAITRDGMASEAYLDFIEIIRKFPLCLELDEAVLVHGAMAPGIPIAQQRKSVLLGTRNGEAYLRRHYPKPWFELYDGERPVIAAHKDYSGRGEVLVVNERVFLIDTGCCYGKYLSGIVLPDFRILQVKSRRNYWGIIKQNYKKTSTNS